MLEGSKSTSYKADVRPRPLKEGRINSLFDYCCSVNARMLVSFFFLSSLIISSYAEINV